MDLGARDCSGLLSLKFQFGVGDLQQFALEPPVDEKARDRGQVTDDSKPICQRECTNARHHCTTPSRQIYSSVNFILWLCAHCRSYLGAGGGTRTPTGIRPTDFKSGVSTIPPRPHLALSAKFSFSPYRNIKRSRSRNALIRMHSLAQTQGL